MTRTYFFGPGTTPWERYRTVQRRFGVAFVASAAALALISPWINRSSVVTYVAYALGAVLVGITPFWREHSRTLVCPYCGKAFYRRFSWGQFDLSVCSSCGRRRPDVW